MREGCGSCFFGLTHEKGAVLCRRHPPTVLVVGYSGGGIQAGITSNMVEQHQPWMQQDDWCGEYKRKDAAK
jgi:hypothetical protein